MKKRQIKSFRAVHILTVKEKDHYQKFMAVDFMLSKRQKRRVETEMAVKAQAKKRKSLAPAHFTGAVLL
ncbi:hypothetical protein ACROYT_G019217 [Oculina patagonica]